MKVRSILFATGLALTGCSDGGGTEPPPPPSNAKLLVATPGPKESDGMDFTDGGGQ